MAASKTLADFFNPAKRLKILPSPETLVPKESTSCKSPPADNASDRDDLSADQRLRIELNKHSAIAQKNLRICTEKVLKSKDEGVGYVRLEELLVENSWLDVLTRELRKPYAKNLCRYVEREVRGSVPIYPPQWLIFNALNTTPFDRVKVVILGQDPFHGPGQAMGLSFSVPEGTKVPSSLANILKELQTDLGCSVPSHGNLERCAVQGVLLLNTFLTDWLIRQNTIFSKPLILLVYLRTEVSSVVGIFLKQTRFWKGWGFHR